jgi:hypothetical protein
MITRKAIYDLSEWYQAHEEAEDAISPLASFLALACMDAGYDKENALEQFSAGWDAAEKLVVALDTEH